MSIDSDMLLAVSMSLSVNAAVAEMSGEESYHSNVPVVDDNVMDVIKIMYRFTISCNIKAL
jgi:hypothetical protein